MNNSISSTNISHNIPSLTHIAPLVRPNIDRLMSDALEQALTPHQSFLSADDRLTLRDLIQASPPTPHIYQQITALLKQQKGFEGVGAENVKARLESMVDALRQDGHDQRVLSKYPNLRNALRKQQMDTELNELAIKGLTLSPSSAINHFSLHSEVLDKNDGNNIRALDDEMAQMIRNAIYIAANKSPTFRAAVDRYAGHNESNSSDINVLMNKMKIFVVDSDHRGALGIANMENGNIYLVMPNIQKEDKDVGGQVVEFNGIKASASLISTLTHEVGHAAMRYRDGKLGEDLQEGANQHFNHRVGKEIDPKNINTLSIDGNGVPQYGSPVWSR